jgi:integrase
MRQGYTQQASEATALYSPGGVRKYLNADERRRLLAVLPQMPESRALFISILFWTGARISEILALKRSDFQARESIVVLRTLKRRAISFREIPLPPTLIQALDNFYGLENADVCDDRLWPIARASGWRHVREAMKLAKIVNGAASPKGMRHSHAVASLSVGVPLNMVQRWLGHSRMSTTAIYGAAIGQEERQFAEMLWQKI